MEQTDAISRSAVLETINEVDISDCTDIESIIDRIYAEAASVPTVDAVLVVHARWIYSGDMDSDGTGQGYCSRCGAGDKHRADLKNFVPYCWKCGARMDAKSEEEG